MTIKIVEPRLQEDEKRKMKLVRMAIERADIRKAVVHSGYTLEAALREAREVKNGYDGCSEHMYGQGTEVYSAQMSWLLLG